MREALIEAHKAEEEGEVPVGAVLLLNEKIVGRGHNRSIRLNDPTAHAEIQALRQGGENTRNYRLPGSILVVTIEPCLMCFGAMIHARVEEVVYGASDAKTGAVESCFQLAGSSRLNHILRTTADILEEDCRLLLKAFFESRR